MLDAREYTDLEQFVDMDEYLLCAGCEQFCTADRSRAYFMSHLEASPECLEFEEIPNIAYGSSFGPVRKPVFILMKKGKIYGKKKKRMTDSPEVVSPSLASSPRILMSSSKKVKRLPTVADVMTVPQLVAQVHDYVYEKANRLQPNFEYVHIKRNPQIGSVLAEYFVESPLTASLLPYLLLDCVTDDLWNDDSVGDTFRFLLRPTPELTIYDKDKTFELKLALTCTGVPFVWGCYVSLHPTKHDDKVKRFIRTDHLEFTNLTYTDVCEIMVTFRGVMSVLLRSVTMGKSLPNAADLTDFLTRCYEEVSCGPEISEGVIKEQLYFHIGRISE